jgi:hypothetical protein
MWPSRSRSVARGSPSHAGYQRLIVSSRRRRPSSAYPQRQRGRRHLRDAVERHRRARRHRLLGGDDREPVGRAPLATVGEDDRRGDAGDGLVGVAVAQLHVERVRQARGQVRPRGRCGALRRAAAGRSREGHHDHAGDGAVRHVPKLPRRRLAVQLVALPALAQQRRERLRLGGHDAVDAHVEQ